MKKIIYLLSLFLLVTTSVLAQTTIYTQNFEGADQVGYTLKNSSGTAVAFATVGSDYITRALPASLPLQRTVTGFTGNVIAFEDHDGAGFNGNHSIDTNPINISGFTNLIAEIRIAVPDSGNGDNDRYEEGDFIRVQTSIDGGPFQTIISAEGIFSVDRNVYLDVNLNGITGSGDDILLTAASQNIVKPFAGTGNSIVLRVLFNSEASHEEFVFDDIVLKGTAVVNTAPTATAFNTPTVVEDAINVSLSGASISDVETADTQNVTVTSTGGTITLGGSTGASVTTSGNAATVTSALNTATFSPTPNYNGPASISIVSNDGTINSNTATVNFTVSSVNDEPSFTAGANQTVNEDAGAQTVTGFATALEDGDAEVTQTLSFNVTNNNNGLFSAQPAIDASGNLTYTTATNAFGVATVTVNIMDNGGTANAGDDTSDNQTFTITVNQINDTPVVITSISDDTGASTTDYITNDNTPTVNGTAEPGSTIALIVNGTSTALLGLTVTTNSMGVFTFPFPTGFGSLPNATATFSANATLNGINLSSSNQSVTVDALDPTTPTVTIQTTNNTTPTITGTNALGTALPSGEIMTVTVNGATYNVVPNGSGDWSVNTSSNTPAAGTLGTFVNGVSYEIVATITDLAGNTATDSTSNELTIDTTPPTAPTVITQTTNNTTPTITGTNALGTALPSGEIMTVTVNGATYNVVPNGTGDWSVNTSSDTPATGTLGTFVNGVSYQVVATVTDLAGNTATDSTSNELTIDTTPPTVPTVVIQTTNNATPTITGTNAIGTALPSGEIMTVTVNGATYNVVPNGTGDWSVNTSSDTPAAGTLGTFVNGVSYQVVATVTDVAGNTASDSTSNELTIDTAPPTLNSSTPTNGATNVLINSNISLTFSENISKGSSGTITIKRFADDTTLETIDVTTSLVTIVNTTATINPSIDFDLNTVYYIEVSNTAFKDAVDNNFLGISGNSTLNFTTIANQTNTFTSSGNWNDTSKWSLGRLPISTDNVEIGFSVTNIFNVTNATVNNLTIFGTLNIISGNALTVNGNLTQNGTFNIDSNVNSSASLIVQGTSSGNVSYFRYLTTTNWHLISSPVAGKNINDFSGDVDTNGNNYAIAPYINNTTSLLRWNYFTTAAGTNNIANALTFETAKGYTINKDGFAGTLNFTGTLNTNNAGETIALTDGGDDPSGNRWNLIGNPYTSALEGGNSVPANQTNTFLKVNENNLDPLRAGIYLWNGAPPYEVKSVDDDFFVAPGQAFFVHAKDASSASASFTKAMQTHQTGNIFLKTGKNYPEMVLHVSDGTHNSSTKVRYIESKTIGLDVGSDVGTFTATSSNFSVFTHLVDYSETVNFAIQALPNTNFENMVVPVGIHAEIGKEIVFSIDATNFASDIKLFLEDRITNTFTRLDQANSTYKITVSETLNGIGRFYLHTSASKVLNTENNLQLDAVSIYKANNKTLKVIGLQSKNASLQLFNIIGKRVLNTVFKSNGNSEIPLKDLPKGVYLVQLQSETGKLNKKIIIE